MVKIQPEIRWNHSNYTGGFGVDGRKNELIAGMGVGTFTNRFKKTKARSAKPMKLHALKWFGAAAALLLAFQQPGGRYDQCGILHSLSGTMAISETSLRDMLLFAFDEINKAGGVKIRGKKL